MKTKIIFSLILGVFLTLQPIIASAQNDTLIQIRDTVGGILDTPPIDIDFGELPEGLEVEHSIVPPQYTIFHQNDLVISFEVIRPSKKDSSIVLCISAAFTSSEGGIMGLAISNGHIIVEKVNHGMDGALEIIGGKGKILFTDKGKILTGFLIAEIVLDRGSLLQQYQIVKDGQAESFRDQSSYQRRAVVIFENGQLAVIESEEALTLKQFSEGLVEIGAIDALYTDMGSWSEGWYREPSGSVVIIGQSRSQTARQTNWLIFKKQYYVIK